jgi:predicted AAA+ superfamily ATPase
LETFVATELRKSLAWSTERASLHHYRSKDGAEVDVVLEAPDGRVVGIEVKASATVRSSDFAGLRHLQARTGDRFRVGLVLYTGAETLPFGDRLRCVPISALWEA